METNNIENEEIVMQDDIAGRLRNTPLPYKNALLPLFEAIINSIQSIEDDNKTAGKIDVYVNRLNQRDALQETNQAESSNPVEGFVIVDNGIGFNDINFESFTTADSRLKESKGGKGVGRFVWLKAYESVNVTSIFKRNEKVFSRKFVFKAKRPVITDHNLVDVVENEQKTEIELRQIKSEYQKYIPSDVEAIAQKIIDHCIVYFLSSKCPKILLIDKEKESFIDLNKKFKEEVASVISKRTIKVKDIDFEVTLIYLNLNFKGNHKISLCANGREVKDCVTSRYISDIKGKKLNSGEDNDCTLLTLIKSDYLDDIVNSERTDFAFASSDNEDEEDAYDISEVQLLKAVAHEIENEIKDHLNDIKEEKLKRIKLFTQEEEPEYRVLLKHASEEIEKIPYGLDDNKLDTELHKILHKVELEVKEEGREFINSDAKTSFDDPVYKERYDKYVEKLFDLRQSELSKYVLHRKTIIDLLGGLLSKKDDGKYALEEEVHKLLYPMKSSSSDIEFGQQNLWLLDEKLTYHYYLASDKEFSKMEKVAVDSDDRPDLLIIDKPVSFVEDEHPHHSVVIIELKRPQRKNYPASEKDPFEQVYGYIENLREGKIIGDDGIHISLSDSTRFYGYIIADITPKLRKLAERNNFHHTLDEDGYYLYNDNYNAYVEIISFRKLYEDAKKRNKVLFDKLGLPVR